MHSKTKRARTFGRGFFFIAAVLLTQQLALSEARADATQCPCSLFSASINPGTPADDNSPTGVNLGIKFHSDVAGFIKAVRFYKHQNNTGTHSAYLFDGNGVLLGSATFQNETATGWQEADLIPAGLTQPSPIAISANSEYVASYYAPNRSWPHNLNYYNTFGSNVAPLHVRAGFPTGSDPGPNGVFAYGDAGLFPNTSNQNHPSNYLIDVVFVATTNQITTALGVSSSSPANGASAVDPNANAVVNFNKQIDARTVTSTNFQLRDGVAIVPSTITFSEYDSSNTVNIIPTPVLTLSHAYNVFIRGGPTGVKDLAGNTLPADVTINFTTAAVMPSYGERTLWTPATGDGGFETFDTYEATLGVKFQSDADGYIKGIRFFKWQDNQGPHYGYLYNESGQQLAKATFFNETSSGWQEVRFATPVAITRHTTYIAAYYVPLGRWANTRQYFNDGPYLNFPLRALQNSNRFDPFLLGSLARPNGIYIYGTPDHFPNVDPVDAPNYWVDVIFDTSASSGTQNEAPAFTSGDSALFAVNTFSTFTVTTHGNPAPSLALTGTLPAGVSFVDNLNGTGTLSGTPASGTAASYPLTFTATNTVGTDTEDFTLTVSLRNVQQQEVLAGNTLSSDTEGDGATPSNPVEASVTLSNVTGNVSITTTVTTPEDVPPAGYSYLNYQVDITAPDASAANPLTLNFRLDASLFGPHENEHTVKVFRNGALVPDCDPAATSWPSACVSNRARLGDGDISITVRTPQASRWNFGALATNTPPTAVADSYSMNQGATLNVAAPGVLANDSDAEGQTLTVTKVTDPLHGAVTLNANGSFVYSPLSSYSGTDTFSYKANDGLADSNVVTVTIVINGAPTATADTYSTNEDTLLAVNAPGILSNDTDPESSALTAILVTGPTHAASFTLNANGSFNYTPAANYNGSDSFTYKANDGALDSNTVTVSITITAVNDPPTAVADSYSVNEDTALSVTAPGVLTNDTDVEGSSLTAVLGTGPGHAASFALNANGSFNYTPASNFNGTDTFTYKAKDATLESTPVTVTITVNPVNDAPVAVNDPYTTNEDTPLVVNAASGVLANDTDVDGNTLTATLVGSPGKGSVTLNANGSFTYTPNLNFNGSDSFTYRANDGTVNSNTATVNITITAVNDAPVAVIDARSVNEDASLNGSSVLSNDTDVDNPNSALSAILVTGPSHAASFTLNANGTFSYTPVANYNGQDTFTYKANDGNLDSNVATVTITINPINDRPVANNDSYSTNEDTALNVPAPGVLANDVDVDGDTITAAVVTGPAHGTLTLNANGSFLFTPAANYNGPDTFTYRVNDGTINSATNATVSITINSVNDNPTAVADSASTYEDTPAKIVVLANDSDVDGDTPLTVTSVTVPAHGTASINGDGSVQYTPASTYNGGDSFNYTVSDGHGGSAIGTVTITVIAINSVPAANADSYSVAEDGTLTVPPLGVLTNDVDPEGDPMTAILSGNVSHGNLSLNSNGGFTYTPAANFTGTDTFKYKPTDSGRLVSTDTLATDFLAGTIDGCTATTLADGEVILTPTTAGDGFVETFSGTSTTWESQVTSGGALTVGGGNLTLNGAIARYAMQYSPARSIEFMATFASGTSGQNAGLAEGNLNQMFVSMNWAMFTTDSSTTQLFASTSSGTPTQTAITGIPNLLGSPHRFRIEWGTANVKYYVDGTLVVTHTVAMSSKMRVGFEDVTVGGAALSVDWVRSGPYTTTCTFQSRIHFRDGGTGTTLTATTNLPLTPPATNVVITTRTGNTPTPDGTWTTFDTLNADGTVKGTGRYLQYQAALSTTDATYTPALEQVVISSNLPLNEATVTITVNPVDDAPVAVADSYTTAEDTALSVTAPGVLGNDTDIDNTTLTAVLVTGPAHSASFTLNSNGSFTYTPAANYNGSDSFTYKANDGTLDSNVVTVSITVTPVQDAPVAVADSYSVDEDNTLNVAAPGVLANDSDAEGDALSATLVTGPAHAQSFTLNGDGSFTYTPNANYNGSDSFTYKTVAAGLESSVATVTITINPVNDSPTAVADSASTDEDTAVDINVVGNDSDIDSDALSVSSVTQPAHGAAAINANGTVKYTPASNYNGSDSFTYTISDGHGGTATANVAVTINAVNDPPVANNDATSTNEDTAKSISVLTNDTDVEGDSLTITAVTQGAHGSVAIDTGATSVTYTPAPNYNGTDTFTYTISDGHGGSSTASVSVTIDAVNDAPVAADDTTSTNEDTPKSISVLTNDTDVDGDSLTVTAVTQGTHGSVTINTGATSVTYTPAPNYNGTDSFTYTISDGHGGSSTASVNVTIDAVNDAPVAADDTASTDEDTPLSVAAPGVLGNDTDIDSLSLTAVLVSGPAHAQSFTLNADGSYSYTPAANYNGTDSFTYKANDGLLNSNTATVTITINPTADAPVANNDSYSTGEDTPLSVAALTGVLSNDTDPDGPTTLTAALVTGPSHAQSFTLNSNGSFSYTPNPNYNGPDSFTYKANDGGLDSNTATVTITVNSVNDPPAANDDSASTNEDTATDINVVANDTDTDGDTLTVSSVTQPAHGTAAINANGTVKYTPASNYNGSDTFTYTISDGNGGSSTASVNVTINAVNDAPVASNDSASTDEDTAKSISVLTNDTDVDGDSLTVSAVTQGTHGSVTINTPATSVTYTPASNYNGPDTFTYTISDGHGGSSTASVSVTINAVNDPPVANDDTASTNEDTAKSISVLTNDTDVDGDGLTVSAVTQGTHGSVTINTGATSVTYTPAPNYNGTDSFTYTISDGHGGSSTASVNVTIDPVNDAPVAADDTASTNEDTPLSVAAPGVLGNDTDVDSLSRTAVLVSGPSHSSSFALNADGSFSYTPAANYNGTDSFTYKANDGALNSNTATVTITINPTADAPVANNDSYSTAEDTPLSVAALTGVLSNDTDPDGPTTLTAALVAGPSHAQSFTLNSNGSFSYTPNPNYNGPDSFTYKANDGGLDSNTATVTLTVTAANDPPVAQDNTASTNEDTAVDVNVLGNDSDPDGDTLAVSSVTQPAHGTAAINANGTVKYTPASNYNGGDSFTYTISDGHGGTATATVNVTITAVNDPPVANNDTTSTNEDTAKSAIALLGNDTDVDGDPLIITAVTQGAHGSVAIDTGATTVTYTPAPNYNGPDTFTYTISDGHGGGSTASVSVTVNAVNDAPVANDDTTSTNEDTAKSVSVLSNDTDLDGDGLTVSAVTQGTHGSVAINTGATAVTYTPEANYSGTDSFTYTISDGHGGTSTATVNVTIDAVNDAPVAASDTASTDEDTPLSVAAPGVLGNDTDIDSSTLTAVLVSGPAHSLSFTLNSNGSFTYTPVANYNGTDSFTYKANDGASNSNVATVTITINPTADAPVANNDSFTTNEDTPLTTGNVLTNDTDADAGTTLTAIKVTDPAHGTLTLNANGTFTYTPAANYFGGDSFTYKASDGTLQSNTATVTITIAPVNDPPVANNDSYNATQDTLLSVPAPGVLSNDSDLETAQAALTAVLVSTTPNGSLTLNANGSFTYTPSSGYSGTDSFTYKVSDGSAFSNTATVTITVSASGFGDTTAAQFNAGTVGNCAVVTLSGDGEVVLKPAINEPFSGSTLPAGWSQTGGTATVSGGVLTVDGGRVTHSSTFGSGRSIEFVATFGAAAGQFIGFSNLATPETSITFGTSTSPAGTIYARVNNAGVLTEKAIAGNWAGAPHRYRIDWNASTIVFIIDGTVMYTQTVTVAGNLSPVINDATAGGAQLVVDLLRVGFSSCTFTSRVIDLGASTNMRNLEATMALPDGTTYNIDTRTSPDNTTWGAWTALNGSTIASAAGRYIQYRAALSTLDLAVTPELQQVAINPTRSPLVSINDVTITETNAAQNVTFTVSLSAANPTQPVTVNYTTSNGTATSPSDFTASTNSVTIPAGATSTTITIPVAGDTLNEDNEKFYVNLTGATNGYVADPQGVCTINNDDTASPTISIADVMQPEGNAGISLFRFPVTLSAPSGKNVSVNYTTIASIAFAGEDFIAQTGTLTFPAGTTTQYIWIAVNGDTKFEASEQFYVQLSAPVNGTLSRSMAIATIQNDD